MFSPVFYRHNVFAELFCEAIKNGLPALQTQHPGIYFHKAAEYTQRRKEAFHQINGKTDLHISIFTFIKNCCSFSTGSSTPTEILNLQSNNIASLYTEYFGIRSMKSGEPLTEQQIVLMIRENEKLYNHSV